MRAAALAQAGKMPLPVYFGPGKEPIAVVGFDKWTGRSWIAPPRTYSRELRCAIISDDAIIQAVANGQTSTLQWFKLNLSNGLQWGDGWPVLGGPVPGGYGVALTGTQLTDSTPGAPFLSGNVSPMTRALRALELIYNEPGIGSAATSFLLYDRVFVYDSCAYTGASQNMVNSAAPARYINSGDSGLQILVTNQLSPGISSGINAMSYTSIAGTAGRTPVGLSFVSAGTPDASANLPPITIGNRGVTSPFLTLQGTDMGAKSIQSFSTANSTTGSISFALVRPLAWIYGTPATTGSDIFAFQLGLDRALTNMQRIYDNACLSFCFYNMANTYITLRAHTVWA